MTQQQSQIESTYAELRSSTVGALLSPRFGYIVLRKLYEAALEQGRLNGLDEARREQRALKDQKQKQEAVGLKKQIKKLEAELLASREALRKQAVELLERRARDTAAA